MASTTFKIGDLVVVASAYARPQDRGVVYRVKQILKVNVLVEPVKGGRGLKGKPELFAPAPEGDVATAELVPFQAPLAPGEVVKVAGPGWKVPANQLFVVLNEGSNGKVKLAQLGGDNGKYWPGVPRSYVTPVKVTRVDWSEA